MRVRVSRILLLVVIVIRYLSAKALTAMSLRFVHSATLMCSKPVTLPVLCGWRFSNNSFRPSAENCMPDISVNDTRFTILCIHIKDWSVRESQSDKPKDLQVEIKQPSPGPSPIPECHTINNMVLFIDNITVSVDERLKQIRGTDLVNEMYTDFCSRLKQ